jgi:transcriptional regulator of acetoin/glycerol metabolism
MAVDDQDRFRRSGDHCRSRRAAEDGTHVNGRHHAEAVYAVVADSSAAARSAIAASWVRSVTQYGLDPERPRPPERLEQHHLNEARERLAPLRRAAETTLDRLFKAVGHAGACVLIADANGVLIEQRTAAADDDRFYRAGLWSGAFWSETLQGTNGIGTALAEGRALTVHRDQHFFTRNVGLSCTAAPLYDHEGTLVGALDVSSCRDDLDASAAMVFAMTIAEAARRIEIAHFRQAYAGARFMLGPEIEAPGALLAVDRDDLVVGATRAARRLYGITSEQIRAGLPAALVLNALDDGDQDFVAAERSVIQRALARARGNVSNAARSLGMSRATLHRKLNRLGLRTSG